MSVHVRYPQLLSPITIGPKTLRNRIVMTAHVTNLADHERTATLRTRDYFVERARGEVGLIVMESQAVHPTAGAVRFAMQAWDDSAIGRYRLVTGPVHDEGGVIFTQLNHGGREHSSLVSGLPLVAPSPLPGAHREIPHELSVSEIKSLVTAFGDAAGRAAQGGFDGVEIHAAHGYLLQQFMSPLTNKRSDHYGGPVDNRIRIVQDVLGAVRREVGDDLALGLRISGDEFSEGGLGVPQMQEIAVLLTSDVTLDYLSVSVSNYGTIETMIPDMSFERAAFAHIAGAIKRMVPDVPVLGVGRITTPDLAEEVLRTHGLDLVGMTRALIADPWLARKTRLGGQDDVRLCIGCNQGCVTRVFSGVEIGCLQNPDAGRESRGTEHDWTRTSSPKRIAVVGGGPAGLEAAYTAASLGHEVMLYEAGPELGGQLRHFTELPSRREFRNVVEWRARQLQRLGVTVALNTPVTSSTFDGDPFDAWVVATGAEEVVPAEHRDSGPTYGAFDINDAPLEPGARGIIYDTSDEYMSMTVAESLLARGHGVIIATAASEVGRGVVNVNRKPFYSRLLSAGAEFLTLVRLVGWQDDEVVFRGVFSGRSVSVPAGFLVLIDVRAASDGLAHSQGAGTRVVEMAGDAVAPRDVVHAIWEGRAAALRVHERTQRTADAAHDRDSPRTRAAPFRLQ